MVGHKTVVVELGGVAGFRPGEKIEEIAKGRLIRQEELAVIPPGNEMVAAPINQLAWRSANSGDTILFREFR